jgi:hypothetical protein
MEEEAALPVDRSRQSPEAFATLGHQTHQIDFATRIDFVDYCLPYITLAPHGTARAAWQRKIIFYLSFF